MADIYVYPIFLVLVFDLGTSYTFFIMIDVLILTLPNIHQ